jgi:hypothetical protein
MRYTECEDMKLVVIISIIKRCVDDPSGRAV